MTPKEVKDALRHAVITGDPNDAWAAVKQIVDQDMYINVPKPTQTGEGMYTRCRWANRPCKCGCGTIIKPGIKVWWEPNWGISIPEHVGK